MIKVKRSYPAPQSLETESRKASGSYCKKDVTERLKSDFNDKCYICEMKGLQDPVVEHRLPHMNGKYPERKFDWDNLFWCCNHCNGVKNKGKYEAGIIDCCRQDPEKMLSFSIENDDISVIAVDKKDEQSSLTAELIYETFNQKNTGIREAACDTRMKLLMESMNILYKELKNYKINPSSERNRRMIHSILRKESQFAAFKRGYVKKHISEFPDLEVEISETGA